MNVTNMHGQLKALRPAGQLVKNDTYDHSVQLLGRGPHQLSQVQDTTKTAGPSEVAEALKCKTCHGQRPLESASRDRAKLLACGQ